MAILIIFILTFVLGITHKQGNIINTMNTQFKNKRCLLFSVFIKKRCMVIGIQFFPIAAQSHSFLHPAGRGRKYRRMRYFRLVLDS